MDIKDKVLRDHIPGVVGYKTLAEKYGISPKTVESWIRRARKKEVEGQEEREIQKQDMGDHYIVTSGKRNITITKNKLDKIYKMYAGGSSITINHACNELNIPRRDFMLIKTAFRITHDEVPYREEVINSTPIEELVEDTLENKKHQYFIKLQQEEIKELKKEVDKYRKKDYWLNKIHGLVTEGLEEFTRTYQGPTILLQKNKTAKMLEVPIVDLHLGKLSWRPETGENYDSKIAEKRFMSVIYDVSNRIKDKDFQKIVFPVGNDFFNFDNINGETNKGTLQSNDSRLHKMYLKGCELLIKAIDILKEFAPVHMILIPGNHDMLTSFYAVDKVATHYKNDITAECDPSTRKYIEFGNCLIGFTHMDKERKRIEGNMQVEARESWGRTLYHEWHGGHLHSEQVKETNGIKIRNLTSITGVDAWHSQNGYVGALAVNQSFVWDSEKGLTDILYTSVV